jgi:excisionase family DNA binding protein
MANAAASGAANSGGSANPKCLTLDEAAIELRVSRRTVERLIKLPVNPLPSVKIGGARRILAGRLDGWLDGKGDRLGLVTFLERTPLHSLAVDVVFGEIPEPDPELLRGFLITKNRWGDLALAPKMTPLRNWPRRSGKKHVLDVLVWSSLRIAAKYLAENGRRYAGKYLEAARKLPPIE